MKARKIIVAGLASLGLALGIMTASSGGGTAVNSATIYYHGAQPATIYYHG